MEYIRVHYTYKCDWPDCENEIVILTGDRILRRNAVPTDPIEERYDGVVEKVHGARKAIRRNYGWVIDREGKCACREHAQEARRRVSA